MSPFATAFIVSFELLLVLTGATLLWQLALSPTARAKSAASPLPRWEIPFSGFLLFLWCVLMGGVAGQFLAQQILQRMTGVTPDTRLVMASCGFQLGLLAGCLAFRRLPTARAAETAWMPTPHHPVIGGGVTFLIALPLVMALGLSWQYLLEKLGLPIESQDIIALFTQAESPVEVVILTVFATVIAPITEELIFRAGLFRYARNRLPRWAALLLPACFFAVLHLNLASFAPLVVLGVLLSLAYERTGRIFVPIIAHGLFNLNTVLLLLAGVNA